MDFEDRCNVRSDDSGMEQEAFTMARSITVTLSPVRFRASFSSPFRRLGAVEAAAAAIHLDEEPAIDGPGRLPRDVILVGCLTVNVVRLRTSGHLGLHPKFVASLGVDSSCRVDDSRWGFFVFAVCPQTCFSWWSGADPQESARELRNQGQFLSLYIELGRGKSKLLSFLDLPMNFQRAPKLSNFPSKLSNLILLKVENICFRLFSRGQALLKLLHTQRKAFDEALRVLKTFKTNKSQTVNSFNLLLIIEAMIGKYVLVFSSVSISAAKDIVSLLKSPSPLCFTGASFLLEKIRISSSLLISASVRLVTVAQSRTHRLCRSFCNWKTFSSSSFQRTSVGKREAIKVPGALNRNENAKLTVGFDEAIQALCSDYSSWNEAFNSQAIFFHGKKSDHSCKWRCFAERARTRFQLKDSVYESAFFYWPLLGTLQEKRIRISISGGLFRQCVEAKPAYSQIICDSDATLSAFTAPPQNISISPRDYIHRKELTPPKSKAQWYYCHFIFSTIESEAIHATSISIFQESIT
ncbi:hypothetical protein SELMODRAFT_447274 [Selaginella moellendorffii]|uniref:Uncharacterized protein n=1 Tax=Selaginella moellendorffii TaxID=88036 RepID=D8SY57_SELML|nr:hypothetical protein SELMODRAFT_447274 [Selaginella moellendorffii]